MGRIPFANYNILSQVCFQQVLYLQKLVRLCVFVNWGKPTFYSPVSPLFFTSFYLQQKAKEENFTEGDHEKSLPNIPHISSA